MKIFLIRHGQTTGDIENRFGGTYDDHLTDRGIEQSKNMAKDLAASGIEIVFSSPHNRAKESTQILADVLKCPLNIVNDLRERNAYGFLSGQIKGEMEEKYPEEVKKTKDYHLTVKDGEEYEAFKHRILKTIDEIAASNYQTVAIITHGGPIRCFFREVLKAGEMDPGDCQIIKIEKSQQGYKLTI